MGCFRDCFDDNKDSEDREQLKSKRNKCLLIIYYAILFSYGLAILILSLLAESAFQTLPNTYNDFIANWNQNPIIDIIVSTQGTCSGGYEQLFQVQNPNGQTLSSWWNGKTSFGICVKRQSGYSFAQRYPNGPKCDITTQQMCGGTYVENKFCMPINSSCPLNNLQILNYTQYSNYPQDKIQFTINLTNNFYLIASTLDQYLPIADIRITTGSSACDSQNSDYSEIFQSAFCGNNDIRYTQIQQIGTQNYSYANNVPQSVNSNVGLYKRNYISWTLECRQKFLAQKAINAQAHSIIMSVLQVALVIASGINFGFVGCIFGLYGLLRMIVIEDTSKVGRQCHKMVRQTLLGIKILVQTGHAAILILAFSYAIDQKIFVDRVILLQCSDPTTMAIFTNIQQNVISSLYFYDLIIFSLFLIVTVLECLAFYVFLHNSIRTNKREERYNEINHSNIISEPTQVNYLMNAGFSSQMTVQQTQPKYVTPTPTQQHRTQELQVISPIRPPPVQQQNLNNTPRLPPINNQNYNPPNQIQSRDNTTAPQQNQNFLQFESFSGSSNQFQSQGLGQRMESGQGQKSPIDYQTQQQNVIREEREEDRQGYQSQDLPKYKPKYYQE